MSLNNLQIFQIAKRKVSFEIPMRDESVWLNESQMDQLFWRDRSVINKPIKRRFLEGDLDQKSSAQNTHIPYSNKTFFLSSSHFLYKKIWKEWRSTIEGFSP